MHQKAKYYIDKLKLITHPEGGYYREIYRSGEFISIEGLPKDIRMKEYFLHQYISYWKEGRYQNFIDLNLMRPGIFMMVVQ